MGVYATVAVIVSLLIYLASRKRLRDTQDNGGPDAPLTSTNFHEESSVSRPINGAYYTPQFKIFNN
jgi:hypothetical protein